MSISFKTLHLASLLSLLMGLMLFSSSVSAKTCKGLSQSACSSSSSCTWVKGYTTKNNVKVNSYCRNKHSKSDKKKEKSKSAKSKEKAQKLKTDKTKKKDKKSKTDKSKKKDQKSKTDKTKKKDKKSSTTKSSKKDKKTSTKKTKQEKK